MSKKPSESRQGGGNPKAGGRGGVAQSQGGAEAIFGEMRTGRDRREDGAPIDESRRQKGERRKGSAKPAAWWLERDYVESHHFVQKASSSRPARRGENDSKS